MGTVHDFPHRRIADTSGDFTVDDFRRSDPSAHAEWLQRDYDQADDEFPETLREIAQVVAGTVIGMLIVSIVVVATSYALARYDPAPRPDAAAERPVNP